MTVAPSGLSASDRASSASASVAVIIVCKNPGPRLQAAVASARTQGAGKVDLIVIDGASTDGTREWLESTRNQFAAVVSESDRGIYDAMNKGIAAAQTEWILFLGADDRLEENALASVLPRLLATTADVVVGAAVYDDGRVYRPRNRPRVRARNFVHHQAAFYRRRLFMTAGRFDPALAIMADYDFNLRLWKQGRRFETCAASIARCGRGGISDAGGWHGYAEEIEVRHRHFPAWQCWFWDLGSVVRFLRKKFLRSFTHHG